VLKKTIYQLEKRQHGLDNDLEANERVSLLEDTNSSDTDSIFIPLLDKQLNKIIVFYDAQEKEVLNDIADLEEEVKQREEAGLSGMGHYFDDDDEEEEDLDEDYDEEEEMTGPLSREPMQSPRRKRRKSSSLPLARQRSSGLFIWSPEPVFRH
jgi:phosphate transporter